jgi:hypothetical protein
VNAHDTDAPFKIVALELAARAARVLHPGGPVPGEPWLVRTAVGIKYIGRGFDSRQFARYVVRTLAPAPGSFSWDDLRLSPDLLRDEFTHCGAPITQSPHLRFMREVRDGRADADSEYVRLCASGTLDARRGFAADPAVLVRQFHARADELAGRREADVHVFTPRKYEGREVYVIADGKHRAALAALSGDVSRLRLHVVSDEVLAHDFFRRIYGAVMVASEKSYSVNQQMVKLLRHE